MIISISAVTLFLFYGRLYLDMLKGAYVTLHFQEVQNFYNTSCKLKVALVFNQLTFWFMFLCFRQSFLK